MSNKQMDLDTCITKLSERWFLSEPLLFGALCSHRIEANVDMLCPIRSGKMRIEYNPQLMELLSNVMIELLFRREVIRILLKHPYQRQPFNAIREVLTVASDYTLYEHGATHINPLQSVRKELPKKLSFEEYYNLLAHLIEEVPHSTGNVECGGMNNTGSDHSSSNCDGNDDGTNSDNIEGDGASDINGDGSGNGNKDERNSTEPGSDNDFNYYNSLMTDSNMDSSALWDEDDFVCDRMNSMIEQAMVTNSWGSIPGGLKVLLKVSIERSINIRRQLGLFKASILSNERRLTRMRPSRRYGWEQMGVIHPYTTRLLIGIDVSGSVRSSDLVRFYSLINAFFSYGITQIDVLQFDVEIKLPILSLKKAKNDVVVLGRGGTNFQPIIDYFEQHKEYDGLIMFTDGMAPTPSIPARRHILWVLLNRYCYNNFPLIPKIHL